MIKWKMVRLVTVVGAIAAFAVGSGAGLRWG
jgi:hypothetical protein